MSHQGAYGTIVLCRDTWYRGFGDIMSKHVTQWWEVGLLCIEGLDICGVVRAHRTQQLYGGLLCIEGLDMYGVVKDKMDILEKSCNKVHWFESSVCEHVV